MLQHRLTAFAALATLAVAVVGCGGPTPAKIKGKVTYKGEPLPGGSIIFFTSAGQYSTTIMNDGTYSAVDLPTGSATVVIETESLNPNAGATALEKMNTKDKQRSKGEALNAAARMKAEGRGGPGSGSGSGFDGPANKEDLAKMYMKIPSKYVDKRTSGLQVDLARGEQKKDFELTD